MKDTPDTNRLARLIEAAMEIADREEALLERIEEAHARGDRETVFRLAGQLVRPDLDAGASAPLSAAA